ncbi:MAG: hypothetical protein A2015_09585 [Spirochaetes bacterium GWF1_31_7]|nr:MAG: hypothetical protein A2Y30_00850 [Spirochaetes bacterium GWE1_32_154]OHD45960.1 MAG: hypothetical protein A2Y29_16695 [Spirochaetes bacterium GWE2_31_10]OHD52614.1 MAG: hypothetical protein A2015_09585 [Spirochaetes bacterium GWF1_31_7]OHD73539.1 MAG: hypothetical protein A2355_15370 [Spirochaetes bacterium RIFOXYB1_FULL_32_8]HBD95828.1 hypothetical protein [Spirochaetia bacterium]
MKKLFTDTIISGINEIISITGDDYNHLTKSLRVKIGEKFLLGDKNGLEYNSFISDINKSELFLTVLSISRKKRIKQFETILYFPLLKNDRTELILQKCTEIGIDYFIPIMTENTIIKMNNNFDNKINRWNSIIKEASMQSGREKVPELKNIMTIHEIPHIDTDNALGIIGDIHGDLFSSTILKKNHIKQIYSIIGPEGDFTKKEIETLKDKSFTPINLSDTILRSETACIYISSILSVNNMGEI